MKGRRLEQAGGQVLIRKGSSQPTNRLVHLLEQYVDGQISTDRHRSASEYVRELNRADEKRKAEEQLEAKLLEGLSGAERERTPADWSTIRKDGPGQGSSAKAGACCRRSTSARQDGAT